MPQAPKQSAGRHVERVLNSLAGAATGAKNLFKAESLERNRATNILTPEQVGGEAVVKALMTTLGGQIRPITTDDLKQFRRTVGQLKAKVTKNAIRGGIRPKQAIALSAKDDIKRANEQIRTAVLAGGNKGALRFVTNAGPDSDAPKHYVNVQLTGWSAATSSPRKPKELAKWVANEPVKFDCDCGRHRYWYRYIATIGGWNQGRDETGYPKIRNPRLQGVACKHVLRVMRELMSSSHIHAQLAKMLESGRSVIVKRTEAEAMVKSQSRAIKTITPEKLKRAAAVAVKLTKSGLMTKKPTAQVVAKTKDEARRSMEQQLAKLKQIGMTQSEIAAMLKTMAETVG